MSFERLQSFGIVDEEPQRSLAEVECRIRSNTGEEGTRRAPGGRDGGDGDGNGDQNALCDGEVTSCGEGESTDSGSGRSADTAEGARRREAAETAAGAGA